MLSPSTAQIMSDPRGFGTRQIGCRELGWLRAKKNRLRGRGQAWAARTPLVGLTAAAVLQRSSGGSFRLHGNAAILLVGIRLRFGFGAEIAPTPFAVDFRP